MGLTINPPKTTVVPFTRRSKLAKLKTIQISGQLKQEVKFIGITLDHKLLWNRHIQETVSDGVQKPGGRSCYNMAWRAGYLR